MVFAIHIHGKYVFLNFSIFFHDVEHIYSIVYLYMIPISQSYQQSHYITTYSLPKLAFGPPKHWSCWLYRSCKHGKSYQMHWHCEIKISLFMKSLKLHAFKYIFFNLELYIIYIIIKNVYLCVVRSLWFADKVKLLWNLNLI